MDTSRCLSALLNERSAPDGKSAGVSGDTTGVPTMRLSARSDTQQHEKGDMIID